jgi:hypothetical protein
MLAWGIRVLPQGGGFQETTSEEAAFCPANCRIWTRFCLLTATNHRGQDSIKTHLGPPRLLPHVDGVAKLFSKST